MGPISKKKIEVDQRPNFMVLWWRYVNFMSKLSVGAGADLGFSRGGGRIFKKKTISISLRPTKVIVQALPERRPYFNQLFAIIKEINMPKEVFNH